LAAWSDTNGYLFGNKGIHIYNKEYSANYEAKVWSQFKAAPLDLTARDEGGEPLDIGLSRLCDLVVSPELSAARRLTYPANECVCQDKLSYLQARSQ
jgi:hypothetical protein